MITEKQVIDFLKMKDHQYIENLIQSLIVTFISKTVTLLYWTHQSVEQWKKFIDYELSNLTLEDTAHFVGVSVPTCFYMRHKLYNAATKLINKQILSEEVQVIHNI